MSQYCQTCEVKTEPLTMCSCCVTKMQTEIERLKKENSTISLNLEMTRNHLDNALEERDALKAEVERLKSVWSATPIYETHKKLREELEAERDALAAKLVEAEKQRTVPAPVTWPDGIVYDLAGAMHERGWLVVDDDWQSVIDYLTTRARIVVPEGVPTAAELANTLCAEYHGWGGWENLSDGQRTELQRAIDKTFAPFFAAGAYVDISEKDLASECLGGMYEKPVYEQGLKEWLRVGRRALRVCNANIRFRAGVPANIYMTRLAKVVKKLHDQTDHCDCHKSQSICAACSVAGDAIAIAEDQDNGH